MSLCMETMYLNVFVVPCKSVLAAELVNISDAQ
jgi:hypothetical protein